MDIDFNVIFRRLAPYLCPGIPYRWVEPTISFAHIENKSTMETYFLFYELEKCTYDIFRR